MQITTKCPSCEKTFPISQENIGKKAKCSACGQIFEIISHEEKEIIWEEKNIETQNNQSEDISLENETLQDISFKPNFYSYVFLRHSAFTFLLFVTVIFFILFFIHIAFFIWFVFFGILSAIVYIFVKIAYNKEKYIITDKKIIYHYGTLFSDNSVEIQMSKITQVLVRLWFVEQKLFKTGRLMIKTAGSTSGKVLFKSINNTMDLYQEIQKRMQKNGFRLKKETLVQKERPHFIGIFWETAKWLFLNLFLIFYVGYGIFSWLEEENITYDDVYAQLWNSADILWYAVVVLFILWIISYFLLNYLDIKNRIYEIYEDSVFFSEWFLTKNYSFIPLESVSDAENSQWFFSKILWIHDVIISSEWSNNQVFFRNMINGKKMIENLKHLKKHFSFTDTLASENTELSENNSWENVWNPELKKTILNYNKTFQASYKPNMLKVFLVNVIFLIPIVTIPIFILKMILARFTTYIVWENTLEYKFEFLSTRYNSFSVDKITQIHFKESLLDKFIGTCSIEISSIGSDASLVFKDIKKSDQLYQDLLSKVWIYFEENTKDFDIWFTFWAWLKSNLANIFFLIITLWIIFIYKKIYFSKKYYKQSVYSYFIESWSGIIFQSKKYATFDHVKALTAGKYPLTSTWVFSFHVSGERKIQYGNKANQFKLIGNSIHIPFVKNVFDCIDTFDTLFGKKEIDTTLIAEKKQDLWNSLIGFIALSILIFIPFFLLSVEEGIFEVMYVYLGLVFLILLIIIIYVKSKKYLIQNGRILAYFGVIYRYRKSILFSKIDFIEKNQWFVHKIFWNGNIKIFTKSSGNSDIDIIDVWNHNELYEIINKKLSK